MRFMMKSLRCKSVEEISNGVAYFIKVITGCNTKEQLQNAYSWAFQVLDSWRQYDIRCYGIGVLQYCSIIYDPLHDIVTAAYDKRLKDISEI